METAEAKVGLALAALLLTLVVAGPYFAQSTSFLDGEPGLGPTMEHLLGTDTLGRDVLARVLTGGRSVLLIPLAAVSVALLIGGGMGLFAGYRRGPFDVIITRIFDVMLTLPPILVVLVVIASFGPSDAVLIMTVGVVYLPRFGRVVRAVSQNISLQLYVDAAKARGEHTLVILVREVAPNIAAPVIAEYGLRMTYAILFVSGLSFLGLGVQPPSPDWGLMIAENRVLLSVAPFATLAPAGAITLLAVSFNLLGDAVTQSLTGGPTTKITGL